MPRDMLKRKQLREAMAAGKATKVHVQGTLDTVVTKRDPPRAFKPEVTLAAIAKYIVCKDIVSVSFAGSIYA